MLVDGVKERTHVSFDLAEGLHPTVFYQAIININFYQLLSALGRGEEEEKAEVLWRESQPANMALRGRVFSIILSGLENYNFKAVKHELFKTHRRDHISQGASCSRRIEQLLTWLGTAH